MYARGDFERNGTTLVEELRAAGFERRLVLEERYEFWSRPERPLLREPPLPVEE
jgi:hypothetical protein